VQQLAKTYFPFLLKNCFMRQLAKQMFTFFTQKLLFAAIRKRCLPLLLKNCLVQQLAKACLP
jgi:hypothetical protein